MDQNIYEIDHDNQLPKYPNSQTTSYHFSINWKNRRIRVVPVPIQNLTAESIYHHMKHSI